MDTMDETLYEAGIDMYEDSPPKKRGRKKKDAEEKKGKRHNDENDPYIESLINGEDVDSDILDGMFEKYSPKIDLSCDTTGMFNKLKNSPEPLFDDENASIGVIKWCNQMMSKENYTDNELAAFRVINELISHLETLDISTES